MEITILAAADRPRERYRYKVSGTGTFPIDMLRYDCAYPASSEAVSRMAVGRFDPAPEGRERRERRTVELQSHQLPTLDRWKSFGWLVVE
jgi:hypothetical protein